MPPRRGGSPSSSEEDEEEVCEMYRSKRGCPFGFVCRLWDSHRGTQGHININAPSRFDSCSFNKMTMCRNYYTFGPLGCKDPKCHFLHIARDDLLEESFERAMAAEAHWRDQLGTCNLFTSEGGCPRGYLCPHGHVGEGRNSRGSPTDQDAIAFDGFSMCRSYSLAQFRYGRARQRGRHCDDPNCWKAHVSRRDLRLMSQRLLRKLEELQMKKDGQVFQRRADDYHYNNERYRSDDDDDENDNAYSDDDERNDGGDDDDDLRGLQGPRREGDRRRSRPDRRRQRSPAREKGSRGGGAGGGGGGRGNSDDEEYYRDCANDNKSGDADADDVDRRFGSGDGGQLAGKHPQRPFPMPLSSSIRDNGPDATYTTLTPGTDGQNVVIERAANPLSIPPPLKIIENRRVALPAGLSPLRWPPPLKIVQEYFSYQETRDGDQS